MKKVFLGLAAIAMQFSAMAATWTLTAQTIPLTSQRQRH